MLIFQQIPTPKPLWVELVPVFSAIIAVISGILMFQLNKWWEGRREKAKREDEEDEVHTSAIIKLSELSKEEREQLRQETKALHEKEISFYQQQINFKDSQIKEARNCETVAKKGELVARLKSHKLANEVNKLHLYIHVVEQFAKNHGFDFPIPQFEPLDSELLESEETGIRLLSEALQEIESRDNENIT